MKIGMITGLCGFVVALLGGLLSFSSYNDVGLWMVCVGMVLGWVGALGFFIFKYKKAQKRRNDISAMARALK